MKKLAYLPILIALLSSCKSASFLKQRYTHFGHTTTNKQVVAKQKKQNSKTTSPDNSNAQSTVQTSEMGVAGNLPSKEKTSFILKCEALKRQVSNLAFPKKSKATIDEERFSENSHSLKSNVGAAKNLTKKVAESSSAKAIIGKVLKIIILILTLALLVAVGALLILLGVIVI